MHASRLLRESRGVFLSFLFVMQRELPDKNPNKVFAAFMYIPLQQGFAATTRVGSNMFGIPGGKVDPGESPREACLRECKEEGWMPYGLTYHPFLEALVEDRLVYWYTALNAVPLAVYKEQDRIKNVYASYEQLHQSPYKFREATRAYMVQPVQRPFPDLFPTIF